MTEVLALPGADAPARWQVLLGDCLAVLRSMSDESVDAIVTDPPYGLGEDPAPENLARWVAEEAVNLTRHDFMGKDWSIPSVAIWRECLRVLRPGGHLLSFGGSRTIDLITIGLRLAGFEIRDSIHWMYGSGFPKSLDVGRAIDESLCPAPGRHYWHEASLPKGEKAQPGDHVCARTAVGEEWEGWGTALKPAHEPIVVARRPLPEATTIAASVLEHGTAALNVDACRVGWQGEADRERALPASRPGPHAGFEGRSFAMRDRSGEDPVAAQSGAGRWPPNVLLTHAPECRQVGTRTIQNHGEGPVARAGIGFKADARGTDSVDRRNTPEETIPSYDCAPGCPVAILDEQSGDDRGASAPVKGTEGSETGQNGIYGRFARVASAPVLDAPGGASRFFPAFSWDPELDVPFLYCPKPARAERDAGLDDVMPTTSGEATEREEGSAGTRSPRAGAGRNGGSKNFHPTVKPIRLMEWLVRLVTPKDGLVLDPFAGSGTTGCAAVRTGFRFLGVEREEPYVQIAVRRIALAAGAPRAKAIGELVRLKPPTESAPSPQLGLFGGAP